MLIYNPTKNIWVKRVLISFLIIAYLTTFITPQKKADAFLQFAIPAGIEVGVGMYVLGAFAVGGGAVLFGQTDAADEIFDHAGNVWTGTQDTVKSAWNASVKGVMSAWDSGVDTVKSWSMPVTPEIVNTFNAGRSQIYTDTTVTKNIKNIARDTTTIAYPTTTVQGVMDLCACINSMSGITYKNIGLVIIDQYKKVRKFDHLYFELSTGLPIFFNSTTANYDKKTDRAYLSFSTSTAFMTAHTSRNATVNSAFSKTGSDLFQYLSTTLLMESLAYAPKASQSFAYYDASNSYNSFSIYDFAITGQSYGNLLGRDFFGDLALPKQGSDYVVRVPPIDSFIPYPKATDGTLDKTKGPLVWDPTAENYKTKTGTTVYRPDQIAWDFPKPRAKVDTATGTKTVVYDNPISNTTENISDTTISTPGTTSPSIDWNSTPSDSLNFGPLKIAGYLFTTKFPFSIPWDIQRQLTVFDVDPKPAILRVDKTIPLFNTTMRMKFDIDFTIMEPVAVGVRWFMIIAFDLGMILAIRKFMPE